MNEVDCGNGSLHLAPRGVSCSPLPLLTTDRPTPSFLKQKATMMNRTAGAAAASLRRTLASSLHRGRQTAGSSVLGILSSEEIPVSDQQETYHRTQTRAYTCLNGSTGTAHMQLQAQPVNILRRYNAKQQQVRRFQNEASFHEVADETLEAIQDAVEELFEEHFDAGDTDDSEMPEVNVASGVLTLSMPPHGTWVLNKQTPNRQIWWSSPISGPRRYEYDADEEVWLYTRYVDAREAARDEGTDLNEDDEYGDSRTLGGALAAEIKTLYGLDVDLDV